MRRAAKKIIKRHEAPYTFSLFCKDAVEVALLFAALLASLKLLLGAEMLVPIVGVVTCSMIHADDAPGRASQFIASSFPFLLPAKCTYDNSSGWRLWLESRDPSLKNRSMPFRSGFAAGDLIIVGSHRGQGLITTPGINVGDVILFRYKKDPSQPGNEPLLHRVAGKITVREGKVSRISGALDCFTKETFEEEFIEYVRRCRAGWAMCPYRDLPQGEDYEFYLTKGDNNRITDQCSALYVPPVVDENVMEKAYLRIPLAGWVKILIERAFSAGR